MEVGYGPIVLSTVSSVFNATLRISQAYYELKAVGEQTRDLLDTTKHIDDAMRNVRIVRRQKSALLTATEKEWIDREISNSEKAVSDVARLIEPARIDMQTSKSTKDIRFKNRVMFVLKDSPNVAVQLTKLSIATQGLNAAMGVLCNREGYKSLRTLNGGTAKRIDRRSSSPSKKAPPSYELSEFMNRRRRATSGVPRRKEVNQKVQNVSFVDEHRSGDESTTLSASRGQTSCWATEEELAHILDDGETEIKNRLLASASSNSRDTPYLDQFATSPACVPVLIFGDTTPPISTKTHSSVGGDNKYTVDTWGLETLRTPENSQNVPLPTFRAQGTLDHFPPNSISSATTNQMSLDSGMGRKALPPYSFPNQQSSTRLDEVFPSRTPLVSNESDPIIAEMEGDYPQDPPPISNRPASFQSYHSHTSSMPSVPDGLVQQRHNLASSRPYRRPTRFHFPPPQLHPNSNGNTDPWGEGGPSDPIISSLYASTNPDYDVSPQSRQTPLPYPYATPTNVQFPPLTQVLSDPLPQRPTSARSPPTEANLPSPLIPDAGTGLAQTAVQDKNLSHYKPLPSLPLRHNPSVTSFAPSIVSTKSEPVGVAEQRTSRGRLWLEHQAARAVLPRGSDKGSISVGFLAPLPRPTIKEV
jgi:hypothetical protein